MKVLMLKGKDNCGKTTTINRVRDILLKESQTIEMEPINKADFSCVLLYRGLKVGIYSEGDYSTKIINKMNEYAEKDVMSLYAPVMNSKSHKIKSKFMKVLF